MRKLLIAAFAALLAGAAAAADVNSATQADLESIRGIGPAMAARILDERRHGVFRDWRDLAHRVKGIRAASARRLSAAGLTVDGRGYDGVDAAPTAAASGATR